LLPNAFDKGSRKDENGKSSGRHEVKIAQSATGLPQKMLNIIQMEDSLMGKGDQRSRRGKIWRGTNGKTRPKGKKKGARAKAS
jgi:30S ribosomal protein S31